MFAEALIVADEIYYLRVSHNCPRTFDTNFTNESNLYIPQKYNVEQKGLSQVARIELKSCMNGQLAFYGPDELLSALCNKI